MPKCMGDVKDKLNFMKASPKFPYGRKTCVPFASSNNIPAICERIIDSTQIGPTLSKLIPVQMQHDISVQTKADNLSHVFEILHSLR